MVLRPTPLERRDQLQNPNRPPQFAQFNVLREDSLHAELFYGPIFQGPPYYIHYTRYMAKGHPVSLRIPDEVRELIQERMKESGRAFSSIANEMLMESAKMRRIPGISFMDTPSGRTAVISGTGIKIWLLVQDYRDMDQSWERLSAAYHWLSERELRSALAYAEAFPDEIEDILREEERWTPEYTWSKYPFMRPPWR